MEACKLWMNSSQQWRRNSNQVMRQNSAWRSGAHSNIHILVAMYMNEVDALHNTWRLCEKAEFGLALRGMKKELKGVIREDL